MNKKNVITYYLIFKFDKCIEVGYKNDAIHIIVKNMYLICFPTPLVTQNMKLHIFYKYFYNLFL